MKVQRWNSDKPHRCPACHTVTDPAHLSKWKVVTCCTQRCGQQFTRWPRLARVLPKAGVVCPYHQSHIPLTTGTGNWAQDEQDWIDGWEGA